MVTTSPIAARMSPKEISMYPLLLLFKEKGSVPESIFSCNNPGNTNMKGMPSGGGSSLAVDLTPVGIVLCRP